MATKEARELAEERGTLKELSVYEAVERLAPEVLAKVKARTDILLLKNVPKNGLFVLKDITKGQEQRIFTYEDGRQVWW